MEVQTGKKTVSARHALTSPLAGPTFTRTTTPILIRAAILKMLSNVSKWTRQKTQLSLHCIITIIATTMTFRHPRQLQRILRYQPDKL